MIVDYEFEIADWVYRMNVDLFEVMKVKIERKPIKARNETLTYLNSKSIYINCTKQTRRKSNYEFVNRLPIGATSCRDCRFRPADCQRFLHHLLPQ